MQYTNLCDIFFYATVALSVFTLFYAYVKNKIELSALIASTGVGVISLYTAGVGWLYLILAFFIAGNLATKFKYGLKEKIGTAQQVRDYRNVFGNGAAATIYGILYYVSGNPVFLAGFMGSVATASADTFATEIGEIYGKSPRLITTLKKVRPGTDGGISFPGLAAALLGASLISAIPLLFETGLVLRGETIFLIGALAGFLGCVTDSLIGALVEGRHRILDNHMTNFLATLSGGLYAIAAYLLLAGSAFA